MKLAPHQIAQRAIGGVVFVRTVRDPSDGTERYAVIYEGGGGAQWISKHRFQDIARCESGALTLADFLGCEVRL